MPRKKPLAANNEESINVAGMEVAAFKLTNLKQHLAGWNPRLEIEGNAKKSLQDSLATFGLVETLVFNKRSKTLLGGHQRVGQLVEMHEQAGTLSGAEVAVTVVDLDETQEKQLNIALNRVEGEWDLKVLAEVFKGLSRDEWAITGFEDHDIEPLIKAEWKPKSGDGDPPGGDDDEDDHTNTGGGGDSDAHMVWLGDEAWEAFRAAAEVAKGQGEEGNDSAMVALFARSYSNQWVS